MDIKLVPKDAGGDIELRGVSYCFFDYETLHVFFLDGRVREYPARHVWYVERDRKEMKSDELSDKAIYRELEIGQRKEKIASKM